MSDADTNDSPKGRGGKVGSWSEHEVVYLLSAIEYSNVKVDYANAPAPAGRNANGCTQKMFKIKNALRAEIDAIKNGDPLDAAAAPEAAPKKVAPRKRKAKPDVNENGEESPKKPRARAKKNQSEEIVKEEPEDEAEIEAEVEDKI